MVFWIASLAGLAIAYLLGSMPTGYLAGKLLRGIDIREHGSRSTGATNILRTLGKWPALAVLLIDVLKGVAAVVFARWFYVWFSTVSSGIPPAASDLQGSQPWAVCLAGLGVLLGHGRSIWLNFTGGKSAATGLGVLLAMSWPVGVGATAALSVAGDCGRPIRHPSPSRQYQAAAVGDGATPRAKQLLSDPIRREKKHGFSPA